MYRFEVFYRNGTSKVYEIEAKPWLTFLMCESLAWAMLNEKGGTACKFEGPNGIHGMVN